MIDEASLFERLGLECRILDPRDQDLCGENRPQLRVVRDANYVMKQE